MPVTTCTQQRICSGVPRTAPESGVCQTLAPSALLVSTGALFAGHPNQIASLAARHAIPAIFDRREPVNSGGLIGYGTRVREVGRRAGILVGTAAT